MLYKILSVHENFGVSCTWFSGCMYLRVCGFLCLLYIMCLKRYPLHNLSVYLYCGLVVVVVVATTFLSLAAVTQSQWPRLFLTLACDTHCPLQTVITGLKEPVKPSFGQNKCLELSFHDLMIYLKYSPLAWLT